MRNSFKKCTAMLAVIVLSLQSVTVDAANRLEQEVPKLDTFDEIDAFLNSSQTTQTLEIDEVDYITSMLEMSDEELLESGCPEEKIKEIRSVDYNAELLELANKEEEELEEIGYKEDQIKDIKAYDGTIDALVYAKQTRASNATLVCRYGLAGTNTRKLVTIAMDATWDGIPKIAYYDDIVLAWFATDADYNYIPTKNPKETRYNGNYVRRSDGKTVYDNFGAKKYGTNHRQWQINWYRPLDGACDFKAMNAKVNVEPVNSSHNMDYIGIKVGYAQITKFYFQDHKAAIYYNIKGTSLEFDFTSLHKRLIWSYQLFHYYDWGIKHDYATA